VESLMQEQRSREAKKAEETLASTQVAQLSMAAAGDLVSRVRPRWGGGGDWRRTEDSVPRRRTEHRSRGAQTLGGGAPDPAGFAAAGSIGELAVWRGLGEPAGSGPAVGRLGFGGAGGRMGIGMRGGSGSAGRRWEGRW
jgi:hypothetical protein